MSVTGERIRTCRIYKHMTQEDVARHLDIGKQAIYKYESGAVTNIPLDNLEKLASLFDVTPAYLAGWSDVGYPAPADSSDPDVISLLSEQKLITNFRSLTKRGKDLLVERSEELVLLHGKKSEDRSAESV